MRILVTGASGFLGRHVVGALLKTGAGEVWGVGRRAPTTPSGDARYVAADLLKPDAAFEIIERIRPSHLVHLAWHTSPGGYWTALENLEWSSFSLSLMRAFVSLGGVRAVMAGSCAEYDWTGERHLHEASPTRPATLYGAAKDATARVVTAAGDQFGVPVAWGRIFWTYGPHEMRGRLVSDVACALRDGRPVRTTAGLQRRDFLHVQDVARALAVALTSNWSGAFNIGSGDAVPVRHLVETLADVAGRPDLLELGALPSRDDEPALLKADITLLRDIIGFTPSISLEEGLAQTYRWWCDRPE